MATSPAQKLKSILWRLNRNDYRKHCKFSKDDIVYNPERDGKNPAPLVAIVEKGLWSRAIHYLQEKGDELTTEDFLKGPSFDKTPMFQIINKKFLSHYNQVAARRGLKAIDRDSIFANSENAEIFIKAMLYSLNIEKHNTELLKTGKGITKEDFLSEEFAKPPFLWHASETGKIPVIQHFLEKIGESLSSEEIFSEKYGKSPFERVLVSGWNFPDEMFTKKQIEFKKEHVFNDDGSKKTLYEKALGDSTSLYMLAMFKKEGIPLDINDAVNENQHTKWGFTPLARFVCDAEELQLLADVVGLGGAHFQKEHFLASCGDHKKNHIILRAVQFGSIGEVNRYLNAHGEKTLNIKDLPASCEQIYENSYTRDNVFVKLFGVEGFSDNPQDVGAFLRSIPDDKKNKAIADLSSKINQVKTLTKIFTSGGVALKREDFVAFCGDRKKDHIVLRAVLGGGIKEINKYLKEKGQSPLTIADLPANCPKIYSEKIIFQNILGIDGFSNKPRDLKDFWERMPLPEKTKEREKIYKEQLKKALSKSISSFKLQGGRD